MSSSLLYNVPYLVPQYVRQCDIALAKEKKFLKTAMIVAGIASILIVGIPFFVAYVLDYLDCNNRESNAYVVRCMDENGNIKLETRSVSLEFSPEELARYYKNQSDAIAEIAEIARIRKAQKKEKDLPKPEAKLDELPVVEEVPPRYKIFSTVGDDDCKTSVMCNLFTGAIYPAQRRDECEKIRVSVAAGTPIEDEAHCGIQISKHPELVITQADV
jgi:hypothetical protein